MLACHANDPSSILGRIVGLSNKVILYTCYLIMNAIESLCKMYSLDEFKEIASHGCESGVATHHIYYRDTIKFFDEYEDEVMGMLEDVMGSEYPGQLLTQCDNSLTSFKNNATWCYIELTAHQEVENSLMMENAEDELIGSYIEPKDSHLFYTSKDGELMELLA